MNQKVTLRMWRKVMAQHSIKWELLIPFGLCFGERHLQCVIVSISMIENSNWILFSVLLTILCYYLEAIGAVGRHVNSDWHPARPYISCGLLWSCEIIRKACYDLCIWVTNLRTWEHMSSSGSPPHMWGFLICFTYVSKSPSRNLYVPSNRWTIWRLLIKTSS